MEGDCFHLPTEPASALLGVIQLSLRMRVLDTLLPLAGYKDGSASTLEGLKSRGDEHLKRMNESL